ncbi:MAG: NUDIX hydrolase [Deltaproteobacteria bacterium]|nr:NUDIX hydrolase [Deltaproteobacteria bacterium]
MSYWYADSYKFCPQCGGPLEKRLIKVGEPERLVCRACEFIFYIDPKLAAIALIPLEQGLVMVRRGIEPGYGLWVAPGGFVDVGEPVEETVVRESQEETLLTVKVVRLLNLYSYRNTRTVIAAYLTQYLVGELGPGDETLEARIFGLKEIPWDKIAFQSTRDAIRDYLKSLAV